MAVYWILFMSSFASIWPSAVRGRVGACHSMSFQYIIHFLSPLLKSHSQNLVGFISTVYLPKPLTRRCGYGCGLSVCTPRLLVTVTTYSNKYALKRKLKNILRASHSISILHKHGHHPKLKSKNSYTMFSQCDLSGIMKNSA